MKAYKAALRQTKQDFLEHFPNANLKKFEFDVDYTDGKVGKSYVYYMYDDDGDSYDITSEKFWSEKNWVKDLNLSRKQKVYLDFYGHKNFLRVLKIVNTEIKKLKKEFIKKYPDADISKFEFNAVVDKKTLKVESTSIFFKASEIVSWDINSETFKKNFLDELYWTPRIWEPRGTKKSDVTLTPNSLPFDMTKFKIYVNDDQFFETNFQPLDTQWKNKTNAKDITKVSFDRDDPYFASLMAAYIISHKTGFSRKHLTASQPDVITSIAKYFVYYHMTRYLRDPSTIFLTNDEIALVRKNIPTKKIWKSKFVNTQEIPALWLRENPNRHNIRHLRTEHYSGGGGQLGIRYEEVDTIVNRSDTDWMSFIKADSDGLTSFGQKLLQQAIESYVYCVLAAQAQTRWAIVGSGAKSVQTQDVFHRLVKDTTVENSTTTIISNMRKAISATNVVLNMVISPGVILIPSDMIIIKKSIPGFNNTLTLATSSMKFGVNEDVNKIEATVKPTDTVKTEATVKPTVKTEEPPNRNSQIVEYVAGGVVISVFTKIILRFV